MAESEPNPEPAGRGDSIALGLMAVAALASISGFGVLFSMWWQSSITDPYEILRIASQEFVSGNTVIAGELAAKVDFDEPKEDADTEPELNEPDVEVDLENETPDQKAAREAREEREQWARLRDFLIGFGKVAKAESEPELRSRRQSLYEALPYLERARDGGFPPGRHAEGYRVLGESYFQLGKFDEAIESLQQAILHDPTLRRPLHPKLATAQLNSSAPLEDQALETINRFLNDRTLQDSQRWEGELIRIRSLIDLGRWEDANQLITREQSELPTQENDLSNQESEYRDQLILLRSIARTKRVMKRFGPKPIDPYEDRSAAIAELDGVVEQLTELQREAMPKIASRARLWAARALLAKGYTKDALIRLTSVRQQRPFDAVAIVGGLEETELLASQGRGEETLQTTTYMMRELGDESGFDANMITFEEFQKRMGMA
ncbi:MAG: tetratricopeptide repeat protein, partial [Planctomycetota bacterium]